MACFIISTARSTGDLSLTMLESYIQGLSTAYSIK